MSFYKKIIVVVFVLFGINHLDAKVDDTSCKEWQRANVSNVNDYSVVVAADGSGDYLKIQDAINASKSFPYQRVIINIKNGIYHEKVKIHEWNTKMSFIGESKEKTIITYNDYFSKINLGRNSTFFTSTMLVEGNDFYAKNLTIENTAGSVGQAIAVSVNANRVQFDSCILKGDQDTLYATGENVQYFRNCYIEGTTDFIFGPATVLFEDCIIHSKRNSYITAASTPKNNKYGFVFKNCQLTANKEVKEVYLGRPWRKDAKTVFINCKMGDHIIPEGWHNWSKIDAEKTTFYAEYNSLGVGGHPQERVQWSYQLKKSQVKKYKKENILQSYFNKSWYENYK